MRLLSWNVKQGGGKRIGAIVKAICSRKPDVVTLQEVTPATVPKFKEQFESMGFAYLADSFPSPMPKQLKSGRQYGELIASKWKFKQEPSTSFGIPWPEKVLSVLIDAPCGRVELHTVHVPNGSEHGRMKIETFEAIYKRLARNVRHHRVLCGDFNSPQEETAEGRLITWGQNKNAAGRFVIGKSKWDGITSERWDLGERSVLEGLWRHDLSDVFRLIHGYKKQAFSFYTNNRGTRNGRRFDHVFASESLNPVKCEYLDHLCELSDHVPMEVEFEPDQD